LYQSKEWQNGKRPNWTDFRGCFPHARVLIENTNVLSNLAPLTDERCNYNAMIEYVTIRELV
jgi:hypothetical protein